MSDPVFESSHSLEISVSPAPVVISSNNSVNNPFCSSPSSPSNPISPETYNLMISSSSPSLTPFSSSAPSPFTANIPSSFTFSLPSFPSCPSRPSYPLFPLYPLYPLFGIYPLPSRTCNQSALNSNKKKRGNKLSHACERLRVLCKNRECLQNCPCSSRKEFCSVSCKYRRGNYLKARLSINHAKLHTRCVLERYIEMGLSGSVLENRRKELQEVNDAIANGQPCKKQQREGVRGEVKDCKK